MTSTNNGFEIADKDLELRGPGDIEGTRQSGSMQLKIADLIKDRAILELAKRTAEELAEKDPDLSIPENLRLREYLATLQGKTLWSKIS